MARSEWSVVPLGDVLTQVWENAPILDDQYYKQVTVRLHNRGLVLRQKTPGQEIKTKQQYRVWTGQFVYSRIDARNGAMGIVPPDLDGAIVSNDFPVFDIHADRLAPRFLNYYTSTTPFLEQCLAASAGTTNRRRLKEANFLSIAMPLPPLDEQQRIVARIEALAGRIAEAQGLQDGALNESVALLASATDLEYSKAASRWGARPLTDVSQINPSRKGITQLADDAPVTFVPMAAVDADTGRIAASEARPYGEGKRGYTLFQMGDVIWAKITPCMQNGKSAVVDQLVSSVGFGSTEFHVLRPRDEVTSDWIHRFVRRISLRQEAQRHFTGSVGQQRVPQSFLEGLNIPVPPLGEQRRIVARLDQSQLRVDALRRLQESTQAELAALLPAVLDKAFRGEL